MTCVIILVMRLHSNKLSLNDHSFISFVNYLTARKWVLERIYPERGLRASRRLTYYKAERKLAQVVEIRIKERIFNSKPVHTS